MNSIFEYRSYKAYLRDWLAADEKRGARTRLADAIRCHNGYVSQVLNGDAQFSLEQGELINRFLGHTKDQSSFLLLLIQYERAGTSTLKIHFDEQLNTRRN